MGTVVVLGGGNRILWHKLNEGAWFPQWVLKGALFRGGAKI